MFDHRAWLLLFIVGNGILGELDERNLRQAGLKLRGATVIAALLAPVYVFASCRTFKRHAGQGARFAYLPLLIWIAAFLASIFVAPSLFDPDAPLIFSTQRMVLMPRSQLGGRRRRLSAKYVRLACMCTLMPMLSTCRAFESSRCSATDIVDTVKSLEGGNDNPFAAALVQMAGVTFSLDAIRTVSSSSSETICEGRLTITSKMPTRLSAKTLSRRAGFVEKAGSLDDRTQQAMVGVLSTRLRKRRGVGKVAPPPCRKGKAR